MKPKSFTLKIYRKGKEVYNHHTRSLRRFWNHIKAIDFIELRKTKPYHIFLQVYYGEHKDVDGKLSRFHNRGTYTTKKDLFRAFMAFREA